MNTAAHIRILPAQFVAYCTRLGCKDFIFQQDGAACHTSRAEKKWFEQRNVNGLVWPTNFLDLNIIENIWSYVVCQVYEKEMQSSCIKELEDNIYIAWDSTDPDCLKQFVSSTPDRMGWNGLGCMNKANYPLVGPGPTGGGIPSAGVFLRDPSLYLRKFRRKQLKTSNG